MFFFVCWGESKINNTNMCLLISHLDCDVWLARRFIRLTALANGFCINLIQIHGYLKLVFTKKKKKENMNLNIFENENASLVGQKFWVTYIYIADFSLKFTASLFSLKLWLI